MNKQERRLFTKEFKMQMVKLYESGKRVSDIAKEYDLNEPNVYHWIKQYKNTKSFSTKDNQTPEEKEFILLRKRNKQLEMENDNLYPKGT